MRFNRYTVTEKRITFCEWLHFWTDQWCKKVQNFLSLGNKLVKRTNESLKFLFVFWRKSLFFENLKTLVTAFFCRRELDFCHVPPWIKRVASMYADNCTESQVCNDCNYRWNSVSEVLTEEVRLSIYFCFKVLIHCRIIWVEYSEFTMNI